MNHVDHAPEVHAEDPLPLFQGRVFDSCRVAHTRIAAEHVHRAPLPGELLGKGLGLLQAGVVHLVPARLHALALEQALHLVDAFLDDVRDHHVGALAGQRQGQFLADAGASSGYDGRLTSKGFH